MCGPTLTPVIALVGGVGSGKSSVARWLNERHKICVIDADQIGHEVLTIPSVKSQLRTRFGNSVFDEQGEIDRKSLGRQVFGTGGRGSRLELENIVHPRIRRSIQERIQNARSDGQFLAIVLDAAVLFEAEWNDVCDLAVFVDVPDQLRLDRVVKNRGWTEQQFRQRESSQMPLDVKKQKCDDIIDNSNAVHEAGVQLEQILTSFADSTTETSD